MTGGSSKQSSYYSKSKYPAPKYVNRDVQRSFIQGSFYPGMFYPSLVENTNKSIGETGWPRRLTTQ